MSREVIRPSGASKNPVLSPAITYGNLVFTAGTVGRNPETGEVPADITGQSRQLLENIKSVLEAAGTSMDQVLKASCFVTDLADRPAFNEVYQQYFPNDPPVRTCVAAAGLSEGILVEVDVIAGMPS